MAADPSKLPFIGGLGEGLGLWGNPEHERLQAQYGQMAEAYRQFRGYAADALQKRLATQMQMMQPSQDYLGMMYPGMPRHNVQPGMTQFGIAANNFANMGPSTAAASSGGGGGGGGLSWNLGDASGLGRAGQKAAAFAMDPIGALPHFKGGPVGKVAEFAVNPIGAGLRHAGEWVEDAWNAIWK